MKISFDRFIPESIILDENHDRLRRARIITGVSMAGFVLYFIIITIFQIAVDFEIYRLAEYIFALGLFLIPVYQYKTANVNLSGKILIVLASILLIYSTLLDGVFPNAALGWFVSIIMMSIHLESPKAGYWLAGLFFAYICLLYTLGVNTKLITLIQTPSMPVWFRVSELSN